jgi:hypothetical protein
VSLSMNDILDIGGDGAARERERRSNSLSRTISTRVLLQDRACQATFSALPSTSLVSQLCFMPCLCFMDDTHSKSSDKALDRAGCLEVNNGHHCGRVRHASFWFSPCGSCTNTANPVQSIPVHGK